MQVGETREGLIYRVDNYTDMEEALAAVGLIAQHHSHGGIVGLCQPSALDD